MRARITLDTKESAIRLAAIAERLDGKITITDAAGLRVNAKSVIGVLYSMEFSELWLESENDIYAHISDFVVL